MRDFKELSIENERTQKFNKKANKLSDIISELKITSSANDNLIRHIIGAMIQLECDSFRNGIKLGIAISKGIASDV